MNTTKIISILAMFLLAITTASAFVVSGTIVNSADSSVINNAHVDVLDIITALSVNSTNSSATGTYASDVGFGLKTFTVSATGFNDQIITTFVASNMIGFDFSLGPIRAYIVSGSETSGQSGVIVQLKQGTTTIYQTVTDGTGAYSLGALNGTYTFQATKAGFSTFSDSVTVAGANIIHGFTLSTSVTAATLTGTVRNTSGTGIPLQLVIVRLTRAGGTVNESTTSIAGLYSIGATAGNYNATASLTGYNDQTIATSLSAGATTNLDFNLVPITSVVVPPPTPPSPPSSGSTRSSGGSSGIIFTGPITIGPQTIVWDITKELTLTKTIRPIDSIIFDYKGTSYNLIVDKFGTDSFAFKVIPTSERRSGIKADTYDFTIKDKILLVSIDDLQFNAANEGQSLMRLKLTLKDGMTQSLSAPVVDKLKNGVIKIVGEIVPPKDASVPVGVGISVATLIVGLMLFLGLRLIWV